MKLSIITVNKNNAEGLRKTLDSVALQTYRDIEHIIVDGGSTDASVDVIREYESANSLNSNPLIIKWISEPDKGVYNAMNKGIKIAHGEYLLFLNSGDFLIAPDVIERVVAQCNGADILCARCNVSDKGKVVWTSNPPKNVTFGTLYSEGLAHQSTFIKRMLFDKCGLYRENFKYNSDIAFWYKAIIDDHATTQRIDVITTDYNLEGMSTKESHNEQYQKEKNLILAPYEKFIPDYETMAVWEYEGAIWYWVRRHKLLYKPLEWIYKIALKRNGK